MLRRVTTLFLLGAALAAGPARAAPDQSGNRLTYLDESSPFYVHKDFPRLTTPMWIGEEGVEAAIILSIDDMNEENVDRYRDFLAPILARLKEAQGYSPLNIFANRVDPDEPQLQAWIDAGVRCDVHTRTHPCPLLGTSLDNATAEVLDCLDNLAAIPNHAPVAFRMPCGDSINSTSPVFFREILPKRTAGGRFLAADSSILMFPDPSYEAYAPFPNYAATISEYPYPYVVADMIWEFPISAPTDWQGQHRRGPHHVETVAAIERGIDKAVDAKGLYTWCFHPHGWIRSEQIVGIIDHVVSTHGSKVRFLNLEEAVEKLTANALGGVPLRRADGSDNGVRLLDADADGYLDVIVANEERQETRVWEPAAGRWRVTGFPLRIVEPGVDGLSEQRGVTFGILNGSGFASALILRDDERRLLHFTGRSWAADESARLDELRVGDRAVRTRADGRDRGARLRDADGDGRSDLIVDNAEQNAVFRWDASRACFVASPHGLPMTGGIADANGDDGGLRFWDIDGDEHDDLVLSNDREYCVYLFDQMTRAWTRRVLHGAPDMPGALPRFVSGGRDRGAWFKDGVLYVANESTSTSPDLVETRRFDFLLENRSTPPLEPRDAIGTIRAPPGFRVELVAAEPLVTDPVSIEFGPDGRVWVTEMGTYPEGKGPDADGRVRILRDRDDDGLLETSTVFARGLSFPSGAFPFREGALVTCAPDIIYMEDTDGDDRADVRRVVFTGFGEGNQQHRVNGLHFGIDNWIYGANGDSGGTIRSIEAPSHEEVRIGRRDFRFTPDLRRFEGATGNTQFGLAMDDFGNRFGASNSRHILHAVLPDRYLRRNPHYAPPNPVLDIPDHGAMARIFPISKHLLTLNSIHVPGHFSSACGISIYRGNRFPEAYRGCAYVAEPVGNIVHRDVLEPSGATFRATRAGEEETSEFLAATDSWFRPVYTATGPDGALYVVDMYRYVIEHPAYIPPEIQQILDYGAGRDRGRIYRVVYDDDRTPRDGGSGERVFPDLKEATPKRLAGLLEHPGGWWRDMAQRLLIERGDAGIAGELRAISSKGRLAPSRVHALWTLEGLSLLDAETVGRALDDPSPRVREHALRLAERFLADDNALLGKVLASAADEDFRVRLQTAFTLGESEDVAAAAGLGRLFRRDGSDRWMLAAILSSSSRHAGSLIAELIDADSGSSDGSSDGDASRAGFLGQLVDIVARRDDAREISRLLESLARARVVRGWHVSVVGALTESGRAVSALDRVRRDDPSGAARAASAIERIREHARSTALDRRAPVERRAEAVRALGPSLLDRRDVTQALFSPRESVDLQMAVVRALSRSAAKEAGEALLEAWPRSGPVIRGEILQALLARESGMRLLLAALEDGNLAPERLDATSRERLLASDVPELRRRAALLFERKPAEERANVIERYLHGAEGHKGNPDLGKAVFTANCSSCHRLEGVGFHVGPSLTTWRAKDTAALLEAILNPGGVVPPRYAQYLVTLGTGRIVTGLITSETPSSITLTRAGGISETVVRADVEDIAAVRGPLMPTELEKAISIEDMAHLIRFIRLGPARLGEQSEDDMRLARAQVIASGHNGLAEVVRSTNEGQQDSWVGRRAMFFARQLDGKHEVAWTTDPVLEAAQENGRYAFRLPVAMGYVSQPRGHFTLHLGDEKLLDFHVTLESDSWRSPEGDATLDYHVRANNREDSTGLLVLEVPFARLEPGKPATLKVTASRTGSRRWFGVLPLRDG